MTTFTPVSPRTSLRLTASVFITQSLSSASFIAMFALTAIVAARLSGSDDLAGWPSTVLLLGRAALAFPLGWLMDRVGRRLGLSIGYSLGAIGALVTVWAVVQSDFWIMLAGSALLGMSRSAAEQAPYIAAEVNLPAARARAIGNIVFAGTIGALLGPLSTAPSEQLALALGLPAEAGPWLVAAGFFVLAAILAQVLLRPDPLVIGRAIAAADAAATAAANPTAPDRPARSLWQVFAVPQVQLGIVSMAIGQLVMTMLMVITPLYMSYCGHPTDYISWAVMAHTLGMFGLSGVTGWLIDRLGRHTMIVAGSLLLVLSGLLTPIATPMPIVTFLMFVLGLGWNFCHISGASLLSDALQPHERGRVQGSSEMMVALGSGAGSFFSGIVFSRLQYSGVGLVGIVLTIVLVLFLGFTLLRQRPPATPLAAASD